jgi:hypothetical protein
VQRSRHRTVRIRRTRARVQRARSAGALLSACISLTAALAFTAPLAHAHLEAADAAAQGLCGEHLPAGAPLPGADPCSLCLAGGHATAAIEHGTPLLEGPALPASPAKALPQVDRSVPRSRPGTPRAPPLPA